MSKKQLLTAVLMGFAMLVVSSSALAVNELGTDEKATLSQIEALEQKAVDLEVQASVVQITDPLEAKKLRDEATALRKQIADLKNNLSPADLGEKTAPDPKVTASGSATAGLPPQNFSSYKLIVPIPGLSSQTITNPLEYIKAIYNFAIGFGLLVAVATIVFAGLKWATSAGNVSATGEAKDMILNAVYGVVMLLGAILILKTINPSLTKLTLPELTKISPSNSSFADTNSAQWAALNKEWMGTNQARLDARKKFDELKKACEEKVAKGGTCTPQEQANIDQAWIELKQAEIDKQTSDLRIYDQQVTDKYNALQQQIKEHPYRQGLGLAPTVIEAQAAYENAITQRDSAQQLLSQAKRDLDFVKNSKK